MGLNKHQCKQVETCSNSLTKKCICPKDEFDKEFIDEAFKSIEEAAKTYEDTFGLDAYGTESVDFIEGAKSEAAKNYWFNIFNKNLL